MKKLFIWVAAVALCVSCSQEEITDLTDPGNAGGASGETETRYLTVNIATANGGTRADEDYEAGTKVENAVKDIRFYFFNEDGSAATVKADGTNYLTKTDFQNDEENENNTNGDTHQKVEDVVAVTLVISTKAGDLLPKKMAAILNYNGKLGTKSLSLDELRGLDYVEDYAALANGATPS
ncbi:MAG: hypothetical protein J1F27_02615, partial [Prevotellaceae bacterium]|nr:hypothetical protein [Prevotellaceae bacterium]